MNRTIVAALLMMAGTATAAGAEKEVLKEEMEGLARRVGADTAHDLVMLRLLMETDCPGLGTSGKILCDLSRLKYQRALEAALSKTK